MCIQILLQQFGSFYIFNDRNVVVSIIVKEYELNKRILIRILSLN